MKVKGAARRGGSRRSSAGGGWLPGHVRAAHDGLRQLSDNALATGVSVAVMAVAIALPATLFALLDNQRAVFAEWGAEPTISVFLARQVDTDQAQRYAAEWRNNELIAEVEVIPADVAFAEFKAATGIDDAGATWANPLPHVLIVTPRQAAWEDENGVPLVAGLRAGQDIDSVVVDFAWINRLHALSQLANRVVWVLTIFLTTAAVLIVGNSIRGLVQQQESGIVVLKLVGATDAYVRRPFLYSGAVHGIVAGMLAVGLLGAVFAVLSGPVTEVAAAYTSTFSLSHPGFGFSAGLLALSAVAGWSGAWLGTLLSLRRIGVTAI